MRRCPALSPTTATTTSDCFAAATASLDHFLRRAWVNLHRVLIRVEEIDNAFVIGNVRPFGVSHSARYRPALL